jgi:hypothetical protein
MPDEQRMYIAETWSPCKCGKHTVNVIRGTMSEPFTIMRLASFIAQQLGETPHLEIRVRRVK